MTAAERGTQLLEHYRAMEGTDEEPGDAIADILHAIYQMHDAGGKPVEAEKTHRLGWMYFMDEIVEAGYR